MSWNRRNFFNSVFISPVIAQAHKKQVAQEAEQKLTDERIAQVIKAQQLGVKPEDLKPRCSVCDAVLIQGKCQHTKHCHFCTNTEAKAMYEQAILTDPTADLYEILRGAPLVYSHIVEDKCILCGNAPEIPMPVYSNFNPGMTVASTCVPYIVPMSGYLGTSKRYPGTNW